MPADVAQHGVQPSEATSAPDTRAPLPFDDRPRTRVFIAIGLVASIVAAAWWMTGEAPRPADEGAAADPPPLVVTDEAPEDVRAAAAALADGDLSRARTRFLRAVAESPDQVEAQVGLVLSGWRAIGPAAVERDLAQLVREYPEEPLPTFQLGLVQIARGEDAVARPALGRAVELGRAAADEPGLVIARLADDVLHPDQFRGYPPMLVADRDVPAGDRAALARLREAVARDDRDAAAKAASDLGGSTSPAARTAAAVGAYDKTVPEDAVEAAREAFDDDRGGAVELHLGLLVLWSGERSEGCTHLKRVAGAGAGDGTSWPAIARPIAAELCGAATGS